MRFRLPIRSMRYVVIRSCPLLSMRFLRVSAYTSSGMLFSSVIRVSRDYVCVMVRCLVIGQNCDDLKFKKCEMPRLVRVVMI